MKSTIETMFTSSMVSTSSKRPLIVSMSTLVHCYHVLTTVMSQVLESIGITKDVSSYRSCHNTCKRSPGICGRFPAVCEVGNSFNNNPFHFQVPRRFEETLKESYTSLRTKRPTAITYRESQESIECFHMTSRRPYWCPKTMKRRPCWCPKPDLWELNSFLMQTLSFVPINLQRCWPRE